MDLRQNRIGDAGGGLDLRKVVGVKDTLEELLLEGNEGIDRGVLEDIQRALEEEEDKEDGDSGSSDAGGQRKRVQRGRGGKRQQIREQQRGGAFKSFSAMTN